MHADIPFKVEVGARRIVKPFHATLEGVVVNLRLLRGRVGSGLRECRSRDFMNLLRIRSVDVELNMQDSTYLGKSGVQIAEPTKRLNAPLCGVDRSKPVGH